MKTIILISILVACALSAPVDEKPPLRADQVETKLFRPSPINPEVPSDPKPKEKSFGVNDGSSRTKRETTYKPQPSVVPAVAAVDAGNPKIEQIPLKEPYDDKEVQHKHTRDTEPKPLQHQVTPSYFEQQKKEEELKGQGQSDHSTPAKRQTPQTLPAPVPSQVPLQPSRPQTLPALIPLDDDDDDDDDDHKKVKSKRDVSHLTRPAADQTSTSNTNGGVKAQTPQTLPALAATNDKNVQSQNKRDTVQQDKTPVPVNPVEQKTSPRPSRRPLTQRRESPQRRPAPLPASTSPGTVNQAKKDDSAKKLRRDTPATTADVKRVPFSDDLKTDDNKPKAPTTAPKSYSKRDTQQAQNPKKDSEEHPLNFVRPVPVSEVFGRKSTSAPTTERTQATTEAESKKDNQGKQD